MASCEPFLVIDDTMPLEIRCDPESDGVVVARDGRVRILLGGQDITNALRSLRIKMDAGDVVFAELGIYPSSVRLSPSLVATSFVDSEGFKEAVDAAVRHERKRWERERDAATESYFDALESSGALSELVTKMRELADEGK